MLTCQPSGSRVTQAPSSPQVYQSPGKGCWIFFHAALGLKAIMPAPSARRLSPLAPWRRGLLLRFLQLRTHRALFCTASAPLLVSVLAPLNQLHVLAS